jgi:hypothetical protein
MNQPNEPDIKHPKVNHHYIGETLHETFDEDVFTKESVHAVLAHIEKLSYLDDDDYWVDYEIREYIKRVMKK